MMYFGDSNKIDRKQKNPIHLQKMGFPVTLIHFFPPLKIGAHMQAGGPWKGLGAPLLVAADFLKRIFYILFYAFILIDTSIYKYRLKCQEINQRSPAERVY
jgi:hypothetical protein